MQLFNNFILIKLEAENTALGNGLNVKETRGKRDIVEGTVVHTPECHPELGYNGIKPNDKVLFPLYAANQVTIDGEDYVVVSFNDIILKK